MMFVSTDPPLPFFPLQIRLSCVGGSKKKKNQSIDDRQRIAGNILGQGMHTPFGPDGGVGHVAPDWGEGALSQDWGAVGPPSCPPFPVSASGGLLLKL